MCGIAGYLHLTGVSKETAKPILQGMIRSLEHRGPDDSGTWIDGSAGIALGHRRLSIQDISSSGHQPMASHSGRFMLVFNGEIYNNRELRCMVDPNGNSPWRGHSDTETLLAAIEKWGLEKALQRASGMFALALWDKEKHVLSIARDRMGEKPLYYGWQGDIFLFGSELKALRAHPAFKAEINRQVLPLYLRHGYIPAPHSIWLGIHKLVPGTIGTLTSQTPFELPRHEPYWSVTQAISEGRNAPFLGSDHDAVSALESQLLKAVAGQMLSDVPLGAFLSGGVDSSTVVAMMQALSSRPVQTFTIGFSEAGYNEADRAKTVAAHLGTDHSELYVTADQARAVIPDLPKIYDEPFGDSSGIPTFLVSRFARNKIMVSLSGDGGDELFGGYARYFNHRAERIFGVLHALPKPIRNMISRLLQSGLVDAADAVLHNFARSTRRGTTRSISGPAALISELAACDHSAYYRTMTSQWHRPPVIHGEVAIADGPLYSAELRNALQHPVERMMATDSVSYLPDDILVKVDRAAMAASLECRAPLLDHQVVELAWKMPFSMKVRNGQGKWVLQKVLQRYLPRELFDRQKMGFGVPVGEWLRGPLHEWGEDLLSETRLKQDGLLDPQPIRARWQQHLSGRSDWRDSLWLVIMFQSWMAEQ